ncbi:MAG: FAD-dependent oxidoreductase, partial [Silicimonas sp.]|nr:FAD-dependent oxidoreductase [Silicimonas sp.]
MDRRVLLQGAVATAALGVTPLQARGRRRATGYLRTNWSRDPFSYGSYSYFAKGARRAQARDLAEPVGGRLFFAGEATHPDYNSTVHAAYESGLFAAQAVSGTEARRIAVIGAGASGLAAASALAGQGREVQVLEARGRIGGRIWTDSRLGMPLDLGASWIHGTSGNPLTALANS